jgi:DNA repair exonuclease SbcCD ATPase subunit
LMAKSEALETDADAKANAVSEFKQKLEAVESELREAVETASEQRSIAAAKSAALDLALEARDGAFRELASLQTELATSEAKLFVSNATQKKASRDLETATKNVDTTSKGLRKLQRALDDATANAGADAAAAKEAREAALSLREQVRIARFPNPPHCLPIQDVNHFSCNNHSSWRRRNDGTKRLSWRLKNATRSARRRNGLKRRCVTRATR